jgi:outer membrane protein
MKLRQPISPKTIACALVSAFLLAAMATTGCVRHDGSVGAAAARVRAAESPAATSTDIKRPASSAANIDTAAPAKVEVVKPSTVPAGFIDPLTKSGQRVTVSLEDCVRRALANNLGIQIAGFGPPIAHTAVTEAKAIFDPSFFLNSAVTRFKEQSPNVFLGSNTAIENQWTLTAGLQGKLITGASVQLSQTWTYTKANNDFLASPNPQYNNGLRLAVTQPLLRGAGIEVNKSPIVLARLDEKISVEDFKLAVMNTILQVESAYWDLVVAETQVRAIDEALTAARENLRIAQRRFEEGKDTRLIVSLANSAVTARQADLVSARLRLAQTSDRLKRMINDPDLPLVQPVVLAAKEQPLSEPIPVGTSMLQQSVAVALQSRPEIVQAESRLAQAGLMERVAKNGQLPQLDLVAAYGLTGLDSNLGGAFDNQFSTNFYNWSVGINFNVPIGNRGPQAAHLRASLLRDQSIRSREDIRQQVMLDVAEAIRNLASAEESILASRAAREAAEQTVRDEESFVNAGAALLKNLLDAQSDLATARVREAQAQAAYMVGLAALERAKGTLLDYNNIQVVDDVAKPAAAVNKGK